jgi:UDP-sugar pyrophosphorylase
MTSDDTHDQAISLLKEHNNFGMRPNQITIVEQDKIPAIADNECHLALKEDKFLLETKPHGHGDIHYLLYKSGKAKQWVQEGKNIWFYLWILMFLLLIVLQHLLDLV